MIDKNLLCETRVSISTRNTMPLELNNFNVTWTTHNLHHTENAPGWVETVRQLREQPYDAMWYDTNKFL